MADGADNAILMLEEVRRTFLMGEVEVPVLRGIDLEIPGGGVVVIHGPSGSGKSTLLNLVGGIDRATSGRILFNGGDLAKLDAKGLTKYRRESVGFIFQFYNLVPTLTALENVMVSTGLAASPMDPGEALELVGLTDRISHFPAQLSGGEQQRVAIARALAKRPDILLCDEPTGALDLITGRMVLGLLTRVCRELGKTIIIVTHNTAISGIAHRIVRLRSGEIETVRDQEPVAVEEISW